MGAEDIGTDPVLNTAGQKSGLEIWRIENFKLKLVPKSQHGSFYEGDAYIILQTKAIKIRNGEQQFSWNLHFWLGENSSQDEQGTAAMYASVRKQLDFIIEFAGYRTKQPSIKQLTARPLISQKTVFKRAVLSCF